MKFYVWEKNNKLKINNNTLPVEDIIKKYMEEVTEVVIAFKELTEEYSVKNAIAFIGEVLDVIQITLLMFRRVAFKMDEKGLKMDNAIKMAYYKHNAKAIERGWELAKEDYIEIGGKKSLRKKD